MTTTQMKIIIIAINCNNKLELLLVILIITIIK